MDRAAPHNLEAEKSLLGAVLAYPPAREELRWVRPDRFYLERHAWVWEAFEALEAAGEPIDFLTVSAKLASVGRLEEVGGPAYLTRLFTTMPSAANAVAYARLVDREWRRRRLLDSAADLAKAAYGNDETAPARILAQAQDILADASPDHLRPAGDVAAEVTQAVINREALSQRLVRTGLSAWDRTLGGGLERGTLTVLMSRPSMGKSAALAQVSDYVSEHVGTVAVFSLEMSSRQWLLRIACRRARVSGLMLRQGKTFA